MNVEQQRLADAGRGVPWRRWGPYLSERQWGTVREDYSDQGDAWNYLSHDQARSFAYRWGEDGIGGFSDDGQVLCLALALWNGADPILKERLFGLTNAEGNHGEDVKEYYFYLDAVPSHAYQKLLYKYPQGPFPYEDLIRTNAARSRFEPEYELLDTGIFDDDRYFDVEVVYAKDAPEDILVEVTAWNRGPGTAALQLLPTLWFRNTWSPGGPRPRLERAEAPAGVVATHPEWGTRHLLWDGQPGLLFTENETNTERLWGVANATPYVKDAIDRYVVHGETSAVNLAGVGTKLALQYKFEVAAGASATIRLRLCERPPTDAAFEPGFEAVMAQRRDEADVFYEELTPDKLDADRAAVMRQALAGMLWSKQFYFYDLDRWLEEHGAHPLMPESRQGTRNRDWYHLHNADVISMPDKWEYPWYAAWDLAFHAVPLSMVDLDFTKNQLDLMLGDTYLHPNGQIPAYEWNFSDVNPPVHAWATLMVYVMEKELEGRGDLAFLERSFRRLLLNFTWWVNRKDPTGRNVFQGGFLGMDNIGVFDRSSALPTGGYLDQADGTAWMAFYCQTMLEMALELAARDDTYLQTALKFLEHFLWIAAAMDRMGEHGDEMWDEEDGFFYDLLRLPDGSSQRLRVRSMVGLIPLCAVTVIDGAVIEGFPQIRQRVRQFLDRHPRLVANLNLPTTPGAGGRFLISLFDEKRLRRVLSRMLDEDEFLGPHGIRSVSRYHADHPYEVDVGGNVFRVAYEPAESTTAMFGGNSNWRGPVWMPVNALILRALIYYYGYFGDGLKVECPTGSGVEMTLFEVAQEISNRLCRTFLRRPDGTRPVFGGMERFQTDPYWRDHLLFHEYFHGDNGAGIGASHQTGWTGIVARFLQMDGYLTAADVLEKGKTMIVYREEDEA